MDQITSTLTERYYSSMEELSAVAHDAAVVAVDAWTKTALQSLLHVEATQQHSQADLTHEVHDAAVEFTKACVLRGVTHATAATYSEAWIREGLAHSTSGAVLAIPTEDTVDCVEDLGFTKDSVVCDEASGVTPRVPLEAIQTLATTLTAHALKRAVEQVAMTLLEHSLLPPPRETPPRDASTAPSPRGNLSRAPSFEIVPLQIADREVADAKPASTDVVDDSKAQDFIRQQQPSLHDAMTEAASRYVSSIVDTALIHRQHNASPSSLSPPPSAAPEPAALPLVRIPTPPPEPRPAIRPHVEITSPRLTSPEPVVELAAVRPPKTGTRSRSKKPPSSSHASPSPPKTAESHTKPKAQRASPAKPSVQDEDPPRLRKLEEYLKMHPVDRAKKIYRPQQQPARPQLPSLKAPHTPSGYDAETDDSDDDDDLELELLQHKPRSLKKLRPAPTFPKAKPPPVLKPVDRPERLGLLNKPKKRSGFCQQCTFEGRSCKISDCLKHQPLR